MEPLSHLQQYLDDPTLPVDPSWVDQMAESYPYFTLPATLLLSRDTSAIDSDRLQAIARRLTLNCPDPAALLPKVNDDAAQWIGIYPEEKPAPTPTTDEAIDRFIDTYGHADPAEEALLTKLIFNPVPDYAEQLAREESQAANAPAADSQDDRIAAFINSQQAPSAPEPPAPPAPEPPAPAAPSIDDDADSSLLTESLARVYIAQRRYDRAYEIISDISLKYPEKSVYFADQLRFLKKAMVNQRHIDKKTIK